MTQKLKYLLARGEKIVGKEETAGKLFASIENLTTISLDVLLYGDGHLTFHFNVTIFVGVQSSNKDSRRFKL